MPPIPGDLKSCFKHSVAAPPAGPLTKGQVITLIAELKRSDDSKTACGQRLIALYEAMAEG